MNKKEVKRKQKISVDEFRLQIDEIIRYAIEGEIKRGNGYGVHFYKQTQHQIIEIIQEANDCGVWEAMIEMRHPKTSAWVKKKKSSTLFPIMWSEDQLRMKLEEAYMNSTHQSSFKAIGTTNCGVPIVFIFKQKIITCCYPVWKESGSE